MAKDKTDVLHGSLVFMVLRTLDTLGPLHGWGIARRIEQISGDALELNQGSLYPALLRLAANGLDHFEVGRIRQQPARQVLRHHPSRQETACRRSRKLGANRRHHGPFRKSGEGIIMTKMRVLFSRLAGLVRKGNLEPDLDEELDFHLQMEIAENVRRGMTPDEARSAALRRFGGVARVKETYRETHSLPVFQVLWQDLRYGFRMLRRSPGFSILAILCLTLGIGSNAAVFTWIEGILLRPFPLVAHQDRMMAIAGWNRDVPGDPDVSWPDFQDFEKNCTLFDAFIVDRITGVTLAIGDKAEVARASVVSANYFDASGSPADPGARVRTLGKHRPQRSPRDRDQLSIVAIALQERSGHHRQNANAQRHAAHHNRRCAGRFLWDLRGLGHAVLDSVVDAGKIRSRRIQTRRSRRALD